MIANLEKYVSMRGISKQDAVQVFMQTIVLMNMSHKDARLIGGTCLVLGYGNPRFSEDIDLTGVADPLRLKPSIEGAGKMMKGFLGGDVKITAPKPGRNTWRITYRPGAGPGAKLHIDTQPYPSLSQHALVVEYPGIAPFVFPGVDIREIMADKLVALAFRNNICGRDIFDIWYHLLREGHSGADSKTINGYVVKKLSLRTLKKSDFLERIHGRLKGSYSKRVKLEWERYLPVGMKNEQLYEQIFSVTGQYLSEIKL